MIIYLRSWQEVGGGVAGSRVNCWIVVVVVELAALIAGSVAMSVAGSLAMSVDGLITMSVAGLVRGGADLFDSFFWREK